MEHEETRAIWRRRGRAAERGHDRDEETSRPTSRERFIVVQISRDAHMSEAHNRLKSAATREPRTKLWGGYCWCHRKCNPDRRRRVR
jgi:hypothetical protein